MIDDLEIEDAVLPGTAGALGPADDQARRLPSACVAALVLAWLVAPAGRHECFPLVAWLGVLTGNFWLLRALGVVMTGYGIYVCYLMLRRPEELAVEENHVSWAHMYRMMFVAQIGFAVAYLL